MERYTVKMEELQMKNNWFKRTLCCVLALVLVLGYVPVTALAEGEDIPAEETLLAETTPSSEPETIPETVPETVPETEPETVPETIPETEPVTEPATEPETVPETTAETEPETVPATEPETTEAQETEALEDEIPDAFTAAAAGTESGTCGENLTWTLESGTLTISGTGEMDHYSVNATPWSSYQDSITKLIVQPGVTSLGNYCFSRCSSLRSVTIPESVTTLGDSCFSDCSSLGSITIPGKVASLGDYCFYWCTGLTSITIPDSVNSLGAYCFSGCDSMRTVSIQSQRLTSLGERCFDDCDNLTKITIPEGITTLGEYCFHNCRSLTSITIPSSVVSIGDRCFWYCSSLTSVSIQGNQLTSLGEDCFANCGSLTSVSLPESVTKLGYACFFKCSSLTSITIPASITSMGAYCFCGCDNLVSVSIQGTRLPSLGNNCFSGCSKLTSITIPDSVATLGDYCFEACSSLTSFTIPDGVTTLGYGCFLDCSGLTCLTIPKGTVSFGGRWNGNCSKLSEVVFLDGRTSLPFIFSDWPASLTRIVLPQGLTTLEARCFSGCRELTSVTIPGSVTSVGAYCFSYCTGLTTVSMQGNGSVTLGDYCFSECTGLTTATLSKGVTSLGNYCFNKCGSLTSITLPDGITSLGEYCFNACTSLTQLHIPNSVTSLGQYCLADCFKLAAASIPDDLTALPNGCFYRCAALVDFTVPNSVTSLGKNCFNGCSGLTSINIPYGVTTLTAGCFSDCSGLTSISIPDSVTTLENACLIGCSGLKSVTIPDTVTSVGASCFMNCCSLTSVTLPRGITSLGSNFFFGCKSLKSVDLPDGITSLGIECFSYCNSLTSITLPDGIPSLSDYCFNQCTGLSSVTLPKNLTSLGKYCFSNCSSLTSIALPDSLVSMGQYCFASCHSLTSITLPDKISTLEPYCFAHCRSLTSITLPDKLVSLGQYCFSGCTSLSAIVIPDGVTTLGFKCFYNCASLVSINFPGSLTLIGNSCFYGCTNLQAFDLSAIPTLIQDRTPLQLTDKVTVPKVFGKMVWEVETIPGEVDAALVARVSTNTTGKEQLEFIGSGRFRLVLLNELTCARASTVLEVETSLAVDAKQDFLFSGGKLQLTAVDLADNSHPKVQWAVVEGSDYATVSSGGVLTARAVSEEQLVTVSATTVGRSEGARKSFRILPKTDGIFLTMEGTRLESSLNLDMLERKTLSLSAYTPSMEEPLSVNWSSGNTKVASVDQESGEVTLIAPGTAVITATAADGSKASASVTLNVIYLDAAKTLNASADVPAIGLQPGQTATMIVSGENAIDPEMLDFASSNPSIAMVDNQGLVTAGTKAGTATITAMLKGDPLNRKVSLQIPVIAMQVEKLKLEVEVNGEMLSKLELPSAGNDRSYPLFPTAKDYRSGWYNTTNVRWESSDTAVAKVTIVKDGNAALVIPKNANGECVITATANDLNKVQAQLTVSVRDYSPRLGSSKITLNSYSEQGTPLDLRESYDNAIESAVLTGAPNGMWLDGDALTLYAEGVKNGTYRNIRLDVTCANAVTYSYSLQVKVANALPAVTVKQTEKFNLFYLDSAAILNIAAPGQTITSVELADTKDFFVDYSDGTASLHYAENPAAKPDTKATLLVYLEGYNTPMSKAITIATTNTAPKLSLSPASSTINTALNDGRSVDLKVWNQTEGNWLIPDSVEYTAEFATIVYSGDTLTLTLDGDTGGTATIWVRQNNWAQAVKLTHKVAASSKLPVIKLGSTKLTLNSYFTERFAATPVTLSQGNLALNTVTLTSTAEAGTAAAVEAGKLNVYYSHDDGCIQAEIPNDAPKAGTYTYSVKGILSDGQTELSGGTLKVTVSAALPKVNLSASSVKLNRYLAGQETATLNVSVPAGYVLEGFDGMDETLGVEGNVLTVRLTGNEAIGKRTLRLYPILKDEATNQSVTLPTALKLTVQVYESSKLGVSLSAKGKLDTLNPDSAIVYTPKLTNCIGTIDRVSLTGQDADKFHAELEDGKIVLTLRDGEAYATNVTYKVQFQISTCGEEILSPVMNVKITQSKVKLTAAPAALTLYQSQGTPLTLRLTQSVGEIAEVSINGKTSPELIAALGEDGLYAEVDGSTAGLELTAGNAALLNAGKSYTLYLDITPKNNATNLKPAQVKLTVKVMK